MSLISSFLLDRAKADIYYLTEDLRKAQAEIAALTMERDEWKLRYEAECEDHEASVRSLEQYYNRLED